MPRERWGKWVTSSKEALAFYEAEFGVKPLVRMVFYHLTKFGLPNTDYAYKYLDRLLVKARQDGDIPWYAFAEDEARQPAGGDLPYQTIEETIALGLDYLRGLPSSYSLPLWQGQDTEVIVMVEKAGERAVFAALSRGWNVLVVPCRGYGAWGSLKSVVDSLNGRPLVVLYFGDFDPSGEDIPRFMREALKFFGVVPKEFIKLAVTKEQIEQFDLPHRPEDEKEIEKLLRNPLFAKWPYGLYRVEMEALLGVAPDYVRTLLHDRIQAHFDEAKHQQVLAEEAGLRQVMEKKIGELMRRLDDT